MVGPTGVVTTNVNVTVLADVIVSAPLLVPKIGFRPMNGVPVTGPRLLVNPYPANAALSRSIISPSLACANPAVPLGSINTTWLSVSIPEPAPVIANVVAEPAAVSISPGQQVGNTSVPVSAVITNLNVALVNRVLPNVPLAAPVIVIVSGLAEAIPMSSAPSANNFIMTIPCQHSVRKATTASNFFVRKGYFPIIVRISAVNA